MSQVAKPNLNCTLKVVDPSTGDPVASHFTAASMDSHGGTNPGARIFHLDATTLTPLDYRQYRIDISVLVGRCKFTYLHNTSVKIFVIRDYSYIRACLKHHSF